MEDVMGMMRENEKGNMEFPRDVMMEDCFSNAEIPLYGFVTNITIPEERLEPCILDVECYENGTRIEGVNITRDSIDIDTDTIDLDSIQPNSINQAGNALT